MASRQKAALKSGTVEPTVNDWYMAIADACVNVFLDCNESSDAKQVWRKLINIEINMALDPRISCAAQKLFDEGAKEGMSQLDEKLGEVLEERDQHHDRADALAAAIAEITGVEIGEHSNLNDPWENALEAAETFVTVRQIKNKKAESVHITKDEVAVDLDYFWRPMTTCPKAVKVQLLNPDGVAILGKYLGENYWRGWAPVPKVRK